MESDADLSTPLEPSDPNSEFTIGELADRANVSRRTVRYYVQRGLIDPPVGRGRGSAYTTKHLDQIQRVLRLQRTGLQLDSISELEVGAAPQNRSALPPPASLVLRIQIRDGVTLELPAGENQPTDDAIRELAAACERILSNDSSSKHSDTTSADDTAETGAES